MIWISFNLILLNVRHILVVSQSFFFNPMGDMQGFLLLRPKIVELTTKRYLKRHQLSFKLIIIIQS